MDPSTSPAQNAQDQQPSDQQINPTPSQQIQPVQKQPAKTQQISVGSREAGAIVQEDVDEDDEDDELLVAPQETKSGVSLGQNEGEDEAEKAAIVPSQSITADSQENVEIQPSVPEFAPNNPEVEKFVEKSPDQEKPDLPKVVQNAGVTYSGPGVIDIKQNSFGIKKLPVTYDQAVVEEKVTELHDSKHWFMGMVMYIWRKLNPDISKPKKIKKKDEAANSSQVVNTASQESIERKN